MILRQRLHDGSRGLIVPPGRQTHVAHTKSANTKSTSSPSVAYTDPDFGRAAQRFDNRIAVAKDQTEVLNRSTNLQDIITGVTHDPRTVELHPATNLGSGFGGGATAESMLQLTGVAPSDLSF